MRISRGHLIFLLVLLFIVDRTIKHIALINSFAPSSGFFYFTSNINKAGPFSLTFPKIILLGVAVAALIWLTYLIYTSIRQNASSVFLGSGLMLIGGFSNVWDRFLFGGVIDSWHLALGTGLTFNLSDAYLLLGLIILIKTFSKPKPA